MKISQFKKIIKEACREAVKEELREVMSPKSSINESFTNLSFNNDGFKVDVNADEVTEARKKLAQKMMSTFGLPGQIEEEGLKTQGPFDKNENPWADFINDSANNIGVQDISAFRNHTG